MERQPPAGRGDTVRRSDVPAWADFFSRDAYLLFLESIRHYFDQRGWWITIVGGHLRVEDGPPELGRLGLANLAQKCRLIPHDRWRETIAEHFDALGSRARDERELSDKVGSFEEVESMLAVRLWPRATFPAGSSLEEESVLREDLPGTVSVLVFNLSATIRNVKRSEAAPWGRSIDELFRVALENVHRDSGEITFQLAPIPSHDVTLNLLEGSGSFVASEALRLEHWPECRGDHGVLFGVPHRHAMIAYPVSDMSVVPAATVMAHLVRELERRGPGSISPDLFWYRDGLYDVVPSSVNGDAIQLQPPEPFLDVLEALAVADD